MTESDAILKELYPLVKATMPKSLSKYKANISAFMEVRSNSLYDTCPCDRIYFTDNDISLLFKVVDIEESVVKSIIQKTYYNPISNFNPAAAKDPFTVLLLTILRYFVMEKDSKNIELTLIYLSFSGKFYPSVHYGSFPKAQPSEYRYIMEYVVNNMLSNKFELSKSTSVIGVIRSTAMTWLGSYSDKFKTYTDNDIVYLIQQLRDRIKSFMIKIASLYYKAYENKNYITLDSDNLSDDNYHLANNDSLKAEKCAETTLNYINSHSVDYTACNRAANQDVRTDEIKSIIETIIGDPSNKDLIRELIQNIIVSYFSSPTNSNKDVKDISFITYSMSIKPNSSNKLELRKREILESLLDNNSARYKKRKNRVATKISYNRSLLLYFILIIHESNK